MADRLKNGLLNTAVAVFGLAVMILVYALVTRSFGSRTDPVRASNPAELVGDIIQVEVRNGCGVDHLAAKTTEYLRARGFDVVEVGDHTSFDQQHSVVIDRIGDLKSAKRVAAALDIPEERVLQDIRRDYYLDASVIIGHDYETLEPFDLLRSTLRRGSPVRFLPDGPCKVTRTRDPHAFVPRSNHALTI